MNVRREVVQLGRGHIAAIVETIEDQGRELGLMIEVGGGYSSGLWLRHLSLTSELVVIETDSVWAERIIKLYGDDERLTVIVAETPNRLLSEVGSRHPDVLFIDCDGEMRGINNLRSRVLMRAHAAMTRPGTALMHDAEYHYVRNKTKIDRLWRTKDLLIDSDLWNRPVGLWIGTPRA